MEGALLAYVYPLSIIAMMTKTIPELCQNLPFTISLCVSLCVSVSLYLSVSVSLLSAWHGAPIGKSYLLRMELTTNGLPIEGKEVYTRDIMVTTPIFGSSYPEAK